MSFYAKFFVDDGQLEGYEVVAAGVAFGQTTDDKDKYYIFLIYNDAIPMYSAYQTSAN